MELKDTIDLMTSKDWKERIKAEYLQTAIRLRKLQDYIAERTSDADNPVSHEVGLLLFEQSQAMAQYLNSLGIQARIYGIDLTEDKA